MDQSDRKHNAARRLQYLISSLIEAHSSSLTRLEVLGVALGARSNLPRDILPLYFEAEKLPDEVEEAFVRAGVAEPEPYVTLLPQIREVLSYANLQSKSANPVLGINVVKGLEFAARELDHYPCDNEIASASIDEIKNSLLQIQDDVIGADGLDDNIREFICSALSRILEGIAIYRIRGSEAVMRGVHPAMGELSAAMQSEEAKPLVERVVEQVRSFVSVAKAAGEVKQLAADVAPILQQLIG